MKQNTYFSPYAQNNNLLKAFFAKPLTLITAILFAVNSILKVITPKIASFGISFNNIDTTSVLLSIAFFIIYFRCRSQKPLQSLKAPIILIKIVAIINIVISCILLSSLLFSTLIFAFPDLVALKEIKILFIYFITIFLPIGSVYLFFSIGMLIFAGSVKKSSTSVYMLNKGSGLLGVTSFIAASLSAAILLIYVFFLNQIAAYISDLIYPFINQILTSNSYHGYLGYTDVLNFNNLTFKVNILSVISTLIDILSLIFLGIFAFSYKGFIKKQTTSINTGIPSYPDSSDFSSEYQNAPNLISDNFTPSNIPPVNFQPSNVFSGNSSNANKNNPYFTKRTSVQICSKCGKQCSTQVYFCGNCGSKLKDS